MTRCRCSPHTSSQTRLFSLHDGQTSPYLIPKTTHKFLHPKTPISSYWHLWSTPYHIPPRKPLHSYFYRWLFLQDLAILSSKKITDIRMFSTIPKTSRNCRPQHWHTMQQSGRQISFLCLHTVPQQPGYCSSIHYGLFSSAKWCCRTEESHISRGHPQHGHWYKNSQGSLGGNSQNRKLHLESLSCQGPETENTWRSLYKSETKP